MRSEEHTSELQSHSEISYAVFCLKKKKKKSNSPIYHTNSTTKSTQSVSNRDLPIDGESRPNSGKFAVFFFFFNDTATTEIYTLSYTLSLHDALPIYSSHIQKSRMPSSACDWS